MQEESEIVRFRALTISTEGREMLQKIKYYADCKLQMPKRTDL